MISVIIPTYNRRELLLRAIASVLGQTCADLECIVVDDASADGTAEAVRRIADPRVRYVRQEQNAGACAARNRGVALAKGRYIAFQDSDDVWHVDKLEKQLALLESTGADVAVCQMNRIGADGGAEVCPPKVPGGPLSLDDLLTENLCSTQCILGRAEVFRDVAFDPDMPRLQDWDLMLRLTEKYRVQFVPEPLVDVYLQPDSISSQPGKLLTALQRLYAKFHGPITAPHRGTVLALHWARSLERAALLCGGSPWPEALLPLAPEWVYRPGQAAEYRETIIYTDGKSAPAAQGTCHLHLSAEGFTPGQGRFLLPETLLSAALADAYGKVRFATETAISAPDHESLAIRTGLAALSVWRGDRYAWETLAAQYGGECVAAELAATHLLEMPRWAAALKGAEFPAAQGKVQRIGVYYHSLAGGGVQRVCAALINVWVQLGHAVTLVTDTPPTPEDEPIPESVQRVVIPAFDPADPETARQHVLAWDGIADEVDLMVCHAWAAPLVLCDLLALRSLGCRVLVHTHSVFTMPLLEAGMMDRFAALPDVYALADGVATLSETDACYWRRSHPRVYTTVNPLTCRPADTPVNALNGRTILWAGRFSPEKRPLDAVGVLRRVARVAPGVRMILLGDGPEREALQRRIDAEGLRGQVELPGYQRDPLPWFRQADVFLCTSAYEGFGLAMAEAQTHGVPVVAYDMPYLTILQGGGHIAVPQGDENAAAQALIRVLTDGPFRRQLGAQARRNVEENLDIDQAERWRTIFADMENPPAATLEEDAETRMLRTLRTHVALGQTQPGGQSGAVQTAFVPMPEKGPFKALRKKAATFAQVLLIDGPEGVARVMQDKTRR